MNENEFFSAVCRRLGWEPTPWRLAVFAEWHRHEGVPLDVTWNPLATTRFSGNTPLNLEWSKGFGAGNWNSVPVRVYRDAQAGITATVETLALSYYENVRRCFREQAGYGEAVDELAVYVGSVAYGQALVNYMNECTASKAEATAAPVPAPLSRQEYEDLVLAFFAGAEQRWTREDAPSPELVDQTADRETRLKAALWRVHERADGRAESIGSLAAGSRTGVGR